MILAVSSATFKKSRMKIILLLCFCSITLYYIVLYVTGLRNDANNITERNYAKGDIEYNDRIRLLVNLSDCMRTVLCCEAIEGSKNAQKTGQG